MIENKEELNKNLTPLEEELELTNELQKRESFAENKELKEAKTGIDYMSKFFLGIIQITMKFIWFFFTLALVSPILIIIDFLKIRKKMLLLEVGVGSLVILLWIISTTLTVIVFTDLKIEIWIPIVFLSLTAILMILYNMSLFQKWNSPFKNRWKSIKIERNKT